MHRKLIAVCLALATVLTLPGAISAAPTENEQQITRDAHSWPGTNGNYGVHIWEPAGSGGNHTIGVCLDASFYGPTTWTPSDPAHARLMEAMATWHNVYGAQALVTAGSGGAYSCPDNTKSLIVYVKPSGTYPFTGGNATLKMRTEYDTNACVTEITPWGGICSYNKKLYVNDMYLWYVGTGTPTAGSWDFETGLLHELGHALGLPHETETCGQIYVMCGNLFNSNGDAPFQKRVLTSHDVSNLQHGYDPALHPH